MPRNLSQKFRNSIEALQSADVTLEFLTISNAAIPADIRLVNDGFDYIRDGKLFIGAPYEVEILSDDSTARPRARVTCRNTNRDLGQSIRAARGDIRISIELLSSADFDLTVKPRVPLDVPTVEYAARYLRLANVSVDELVIEGDIVSYDLTQEPYPRDRATKGRTPALFR